MWKWIENIMRLLAALLKWDMQQEPLTPEVPSEPDTPAPIAPAPEAVPAPVEKPSDYLTTIVPWTSKKANFHNVRVICDQEGLTLVQKNTLCACVYQESRFLTNPTPNKNRDPETGEVWSTDYGIVQVNDHYNIGPGMPFPSVQYVLDNPEACVRWMAKHLKRTSGLSLWASWTSGVYREWLAKDSPMWELMTYDYEDLAT